MPGALYAGTVYFERLTSAGADAGNGLVKVGRTGNLEIQYNNEIKEQKWMTVEKYGQLSDSVTLAQPATGSLVLREFSKDNLALAMLGETSVVSQAEATASSASVDAILDEWVEIADGKFDFTVTAVADSTATSLTEGTDYELAAYPGLIKFLSTSSAVTEGETCTVTYNLPAKTLYKIDGHTEPVVRARIVLHGKNQVDGSQGRLEIWDATVRPSGGIGFISEDFQEVTLEMNLNTPDTKDGPTQWIAEES